MEEQGKLQTYTDGTYATATQPSRRLSPIRVEKKCGVHRSQHKNLIDGVGPFDQKMKNRQIDPFPPPSETLAKEGQGNSDDTNGQRLCEQLL